MNIQNSIENEFQSSRRTKKTLKRMKHFLVAFCVLLSVLGFSNLNKVDCIVSKYNMKMDFHFLLFSISFFFNVAFFPSHPLYICSNGFIIILVFCFVIRQK